MDNINDMTPEDWRDEMSAEDWREAVDAWLPIGWMAAWDLSGGFQALAYDLAGSYASSHPIPDGATLNNIKEAILETLAERLEEAVARLPLLSHSTEEVVDVILGGDPVYLVTYHDNDRGPQQDVLFGDVEEIREDVRQHGGCYPEKVERLTHIHV